MTGLIQRKPSIFTFYDERMDGFDSPIELQRYLRLLGSLAADFTSRNPIAGCTYIWPPVTLLLDSSSEKSVLMRLYKIMESVLGDSGFALPVLSSLSVIYHVPKENTVLAAAAQFRVVPLQ